VLLPQTRLGQLSYKPLIIILGDEEVLVNRLMSNETNKPPLDMGGSVARILIILL
jgi:hypothetical protein